MATNIDDLQIEISASAKDANSEISSLVAKLSRLQKSLTSVGGSGFKNYTNNASKATNQTKSFGSMLNKMNNSANRTAKSTKSLAYAFGKFYANYFLFIRAFKGLFNSIESTADYIEAFNYFTVSMGKVASKWDSQWENYADENARNYSNKFFTTLDKTFGKLSGVSYDPETGLLSETGLKNLGLNLQEITQYAAQLSSMMDSVGQSGETTLATTNAFVKLAGDISSLYNIDYSNAANKIRSVLQGQSRAGYGLGWDTTMASLQNTADKFDLSKPVSEMSQMEKQQLRILTILEQSRVAWGDQSNTINTVANQMRLFKNNISELGMTLGQLFIPVLQKVLPIINGVTIAIKRLMSNIAGFLGVKIEDTGQGFTDMDDEIGEVADSLDDATASAKKLKTATLGIDELNINAPQDDTTGGSGAVGGGIDLTDEILKATDEYNKVWQEAFDKMESRAQAFADNVEKFLEPIKKMFENLSFGNFEGAGSNLSEFFSQIMDINWDNEYAKASGFGTGLAEFLNGLISPELFGKVGETIAGSLNATLNFLNSFGETFEWTEFGESLASGFKGFIEKWDAGLTAETLSTFASGVLEAITGAITELGENNSFEDLGQKIVDFVCGIKWGELSWNLYNFFKAMKDAMIELPSDFATGIIEGIAKNIFGVENFEFEMPEGIKIAAEKALNQLFPPMGIFNRILNVDEDIANLTTWWEEISPWFSAEKWEEKLQGIRKAMEIVWLGITIWWENTALKQWWNKVTKWFEQKKWEDALSGIKNAFENVWNGAIQSIKNIWNRFANWLNEKLTINIDTSSLIGQGIAKILGTSTLKLANLPTYQTGGFPEDGLFMANHNELVGQFSNGKTAVANNEQIVAGIKEGVREAVSEILAPYLSDIAQNTRETADKDFSVNIGDRDIARANARGQRSLGYSLVT